VLSEIGGLSSPNWKDSANVFATLDRLDAGPITSADLCCERLRCEADYS
jgi:hypothetical protein